MQTDKPNSKYFFFYKRNLQTNIKLRNR